MSQYGGEVGFEGRMLWLPSHLLDSKVCGNVRNHHQKQQQSHRRLPSELQSQQQYPKSTSRSSFERPKHAMGGPGMQAIFLSSSGQRSCGTGVFLPQKAGSKPTNKNPACAPVLLPARVIEALNLKVHALGLQISPSDEGLGSKRSEEVYKNESTTKKKNHRKDNGHRKSSSQDIFLPKEWTY